MKAIYTLMLLVMVVFTSSAQATRLKAGDSAPDFNLKASDGKTYSLSDFKGKQAVVIAWFPKAYTRGCTIECKSLVEKGHLIKEFDVTYFMVSVDPLDDNKGFAEKYKADFPLLSDPTKEVAKKYDVLNIFRVASRVTFYIDKQGNIIKVDDDVNPATSAEDMAANLAKLGIAKL